VTNELDTYTEDRADLVAPQLSIGLKDQDEVEPSTVGGYQIAPLRVMIADDVAMIRRFLRAVIESCWNYNVIAMAVDGPQAVRTAEAFQPDVVLLDMLMPRTYGTSVLSGIRRVLPYSRVVIVSGIDPALEVSLLEAGASGFVSKQATPLEFRDRLMDTLNRSVLEWQSEFIKPSFGDNLADAVLPFSSASVKAHL
jgi:DNA-binding NarL/FixJ family response regulator